MENKRELFKTRQYSKHCKCHKCQKLEVYYKIYGIYFCSECYQKKFNCSINEEPYYLVGISSSTYGDCVKCGLHDIYGEKWNHTLRDGKGCYDRLCYKCYHQELENFIRN